MRGRPRLMWDAFRMPWIPELFSAPALERLEAKWQRERLDAVSYFEGLGAGELDAPVNSFAREPELHDPVRGRIRGVRAFEAFVNETNAFLAQRNVSVEDVNHVITERRGFEEEVLHYDDETGRVELPAAIVATFEPDGYAREPAGSRYIHRGRDALRAFYEQLFSNGGGIPLEHCALVDDGHACALEYNVVSWGATELRPEAGVAVYVRGQSGKLAAARIYDDTDPPLGGAA